MRKNTGNNFHVMNSQFMFQEALPSKDTSKKTKDTRLSWWKSLWVIYFLIKDLYQEYIKNS